MKRTEPTANDHYWFLHSHPGVLIRVAKPGAEPYMLTVPEDRLDAALVKACREFCDTPDRNIGGPELPKVVYSHAEQKRRRKAA
jgi:hypothetical protein